MPRLLQIFLLTLVIALVGVIYAPLLLAFPYKQSVGPITVYSETPIMPALETDMTKADALLAESPIWQPNAHRDIYLTQGGWRWRLLALQSGGAFAFRRPFTNAIVVNRSDMNGDRVSNGRAIGGVRTLSGVLAHETTHLMVALHIGEVRAAMLPAWKKEGYPDFVAHESSLSDGEALRLRASGEHPIALDYYDYRRQVTAALAHNGNSVDRLLSE